MFDFFAFTILASKQLAATWRKSTAFAQKSTFDEKDSTF